MAGPFIMPCKSMLPSDSAMDLVFRAPMCGRKILITVPGNRWRREFKLEPEPLRLLPNYTARLPLGRPAAPEPQLSLERALAQVRDGCASFAPLGLELGGIFTAQNGMPFTPEISVDRARIGNVVPMKDRITMPRLLGRSELTP